MKKFLLISFIFLQSSICYAATQVKVTALDNFNTEKPRKNINVMVRESIVLGDYNLYQGTDLNCNVIQIKGPKRGKRNAVFWVQPVSMTYEGKTSNFTQEMYGKYSKRILSKEELKKIPPSKIIKKTALSIGNYFVKGLSTGVSFAKGIVENEKDNRLKSGVVKAYEESPLSYINEGEELDIKVGDEFYLIFKIHDDDTNDEPNYSYTIND